MHHKVIAAIGRVRVYRRLYGHGIGQQQRSLHIFIPGQLSFWQRYSIPLTTCFAMATGTSLVLHLVYEAMYADHVRTLKENEIEALEQKIEQLEKSV